MLCKSLSLETQTGEEWRPVVGFEGLYEVSNLGRVKSLKREFTDSMGRHIIRPFKILKILIQSQTGYPYLTLHKNKKQYHPNIHRLVAEAFLPNPDNLPCVNHKDEDRTNSILSNLEWCTYGYNNTYNNNQRVRQTTRYRKRGSRKICQYDLNGNLIRKYDMWPLEFQRIYGMRIQGCIDGSKQTAYGYVWRYEGEPFNYTPKHIHGPQMIVQMFDSKGLLVKVFDGVAKALQELGTCKQTFNESKDENGLFHYKGYTFKKIRKSSLL